MKKQRRINIDFSNSRARFSHRTNEATLVVGRKPAEDSISKTKGQTSIPINSNVEDEQNSQSKDRLLMLKFGNKSVSQNNIKQSSESPKFLSAPNNNSIFNGNDELSLNITNYKPVTLTVKFHETRTSPETVLIDPMLVPSAKVGDIGEIQCTSGSKRKFFFKFQEFKTDKTNIVNPIGLEKLSGTLKNDNSGEADANFNSSTPVTNINTSLDFKNEQLDENTSTTEINDAPDLTTSANNVISILSGPIVSTLDLKPRSQVIVRVRTKESIQADTVEIYVKDIHLSRGDMWNISSLLMDKCVYKNQKISFINGSIRLNVDKIYKNGHKFFSSYIGKDTKIVFRSDSARLIVFIQISSEMWHFEESGQQLFHKLVNSFFPKAFQKWKDLGTHHLITIIFFSSVDLEGEKIRYSEGETPSNKTDYYRVVVDQVHILLWNEIMATLRLEFANFKKDIYLHRNKNRDEQHPQEYVIEGSILPSAKGSILEAINLGMSLVSDDFKNSYLRQTTNHFVLITPGTGLFDVSYDMLIRTSKLMTTVDSTVDIICLSQAPLHIVPLVRYLDNQNRLKHCIPNWLDISFWTDSSQAVHQWLPKCKIYELQMMGVMENELSTVNINDLELTNYISAKEAMEAYDKDVFGTTLSKKEKKFKNKHVTLPTNIVGNLNRTSSLSVGKTDDGLKPTELLVSNNKSSPATCNAFGVTTTSKPNVSAFSSLLSLSKNTDVKTPTSTAYSFVRKMISTPILRPTSTSSPSFEKTNNSDSTLDFQKIEAITLNDSSPSNSSERSISQPSESRKPITSTISLENPVSYKNNIVDTLKNQKLMAPTSKYQKKARSKKVSKKLIKSKKIQGRDSISNSYWTNIINPSNTLITELLSMISYGRWRFVFPPDVKRKSVKWSSLSSPASLPTLTSIFPTLTDFNQNYTFRIYDVILNQDIVNENQTSETLMKNMISLRLTLGFQICIGENVNKVEKHRKPNGDSKLLIQYLNSDNYNGSRLYLSLGNEIHRICCDYNGLINVQVYKRVSSTDEQLTLLNDKEYIENIRTRYSENYSAVKISSSTNANMRNYNWNQLDQVLAGYNESIDKQKYHRMKFVILPAAIPENTYSISNEKLTTEEIRLEGIRSLIMNIYKIRFRTNEEKKINKKLEIAPDIYFYTGSLYNYLNHESESNKTSKKKVNSSLLSSNSNISMFKSQQYNKSIDLYKFVSILQSDEGIPILDRYWHLKRYKYCFVGMDLVNFLIENFNDIETREEAVEYGNKLMEQKVFLHVVSKHHFLDGHYFYYINKKFTKPNTVDEIKDDNSINDKTQGHLNQSPRSMKSIKSLNDESKEENNEKKSNNNLETSENCSQTIMLSREVLCDLDPNGYSWQPELIKVHYDIVHNPEHCFHLRIEWLNTTSKLIEDLINGWSKYCERYGLSLVEIPWEELFTLPIRNPLHSTIEIKLCINPWTDDEFKGYDKIFKNEKYYFHLYLLKMGSFMLDNRTATYFKDDKFDVIYSWGKPMFKYAQFIHSTGGYIAELRNNGDFFMAPNNAHISRLNLNIGKLHNLGKSKAIYFDSQSVMLDFRSYCQDKVKLREIFREGVKAWENNEDFL
jgi:hypothetical protein